MIQISTYPVQFKLLQVQDYVNACYSPSPFYRSHHDDLLIWMGRLGEILE